MVVLVLVAAASSRAPETTAMLAAAHQAMGPEVEIIVRSPELMPAENDALTLAVSLHADAVVEADWQPPESTHAVVRMHPGAQAGWTHRELIFRASDDPSERGRTIGFVIASMLPESRPSNEAPAAVPAPAASAGAQSHADANGPEIRTLLALTPSTSRAPGTGDASDTVDRVDSEVSRGIEGNGALPRRAIDATGVAAVPIGGHTERFGGALRMRWALSPSLSAHIATSVRAGTVEPAQASVFAWFGAIGAAFTPIRERRHGPGLGVRIEGGAKYLATTHFSSDDPTPDLASRWLPFAAMAWECSYGLQAATALIASVGGEVAFGDTDIYLHRRWAARLTPFALTGELGVRARF